MRNTERQTSVRHENLRTRTKQFALDVIAFCERLSKDETSHILARQLLRAGTSVGANYRTACRAESKRAFISKLADVLEEADECGYWFELLAQSGKADASSVEPLQSEADALTAIAVASINTAKRSLRADTTT